MDNFRLEQDDFWGDVLGDSTDYLLATTPAVTRERSHTNTTTSSSGFASTPSIITSPVSREDLRVYTSGPNPEYLTSYVVDLDGAYDMPALSPSQTSQVSFSGSPSAYEQTLSVHSPSAGLGGSWIGGTSPYDSMAHSPLSQTSPLPFTGSNSPSAVDLSLSALSPVSALGGSGGYDSLSTAASPVALSPPRLSLERIDWEMYDYVCDLENGSYWRLRPEHDPKPPQLPKIIPHNDELRPAELRTNSEDHPCLVPNCAANPFKRKADLERHYKQVHRPEGSKEAYYCDYQNCPRRNGAFHRRDHFRDHLREQHREDIWKRGSGGSGSGGGGGGGSSSASGSATSASRSMAHGPKAGGSIGGGGAGGSGATTNGNERDQREWMESRSISKKWWRCTKCLRRVMIRTHKFECPGCKLPLEEERHRLRRQREKMRAASGGGSGGE